MREDDVTSAQGKMEHRAVFGHDDVEAGHVASDAHQIRESSTGHQDYRDSLLTRRSDGVSHAGVHCASRQSCRRSQGRSRRASSDDNLGNGKSATRVPIAQARKDVVKCRSALTADAEISPRARNITQGVLGIARLLRARVPLTARGTGVADSEQMSNISNILCPVNLFGRVKTDGCTRNCLCGGVQRANHRPLCVRARVRSSARPAPASGADIRHRATVGARSDRVVLSERALIWDRGRCGH